MKLIRKARLYLKEGKSDKVYEVDLCDTGQPSPERYIVNFRYGRRGSNLREGTKTVDPVSLSEANEIFDSVVVSKTNKGYKNVEPESPTLVSSSPSASVSDEQPGENKQQQILMQRLTAARQKAITPKEVSRTVWRAGELGMRQAAPLISALILSEDALLDYCIAWSLGRCGDASVIPSLEHLQQRYGLNHVGRMAREAILTLADADKKSSLYASILNSFPQSLQQAIHSEHSDAILSSLEMLLKSESTECLAILADCYTLAKGDNNVHAALHRLLQSLPLQPDTFRSVRQIFKTAEYRQDAKMFGLLAYRFDNSHAYYSNSYGYAYSPKIQRYVDVSKYIGKENSPFAYSNRTRDYLRRRTWRTLRRLGEVGNEQYTQLASEVLLHVQDHDAQPNVRSEYWNYEQRRTITRYFDPYSRFVAFNHIINQHNPRITLSSTGLSWVEHRDVADVPAHRSEAYPELWDKQPQSLLSLLIQSGCAVVHQFAARALKANQSFLNTIAIDDIILLLGKPYIETAELGLQLARAQITAGNINERLILALINGFSEEARQVGRDVINAKVGWLLDYPELLFEIICSPYADNRLWIRRLATELVLDDQFLQSLIGRLISKILELGENEAQNKQLVEDIAWMLLNVYAQQSRALGFSIIEDLLAHKAECVQVVGARLLLNHASDVEHLPPKLLRTVMEAESAEVRAIGVQLFGQFPDEVLLQQPALLVALAVSKDAQVRKAAIPIMGRLAQQHVEFARGALQKLMGYLFLAEEAEGVHEDILNLIDAHLGHVVQELDLNTTWRLLQSRSKAAKQFGASMLGRFPYQEFSVRQIARLAAHDYLQVRQWACQGFKENVARIKQEAQDALVILDNPWDEVREFGFNYFNQQFQAEDWNPDLLISICDSTRNDVQNYGRELISRFFEENQGINYLLKLSQHPSNNVQLFASNFLKQYASGNIEHLIQLRLYFVTVLSQVNRARAAKSRIVQFLGEEALKSEDAAALVAEIFSRQSVTAAIVDKSACIAILLQIRQKYPAVDSPLLFISPARKGATSSQAVN